MVSVQLHVFAQILTTFISAANAMYYLYIYKCTKRGHLMKWEVAWVAIVETLNYTIQISTGSEQIELAGGAKFPWMRYVGWQLTCPVLLTFIVTNMLEAPTTRVVVQMLMLLQFIILSGMTASLLQPMTLKVIFVLLAASALIWLYYSLYTKRKNKQLPMANNKEMHLLLYFMASWLVFPFMFILGPEMLDAMPFEWTLVGHCIGDLISKNAFGMLAWQYTKYLHRDEIKEIKKNLPEVDDVESIHSAAAVSTGQGKTTHISLPINMLPMFMYNNQNTPKHDNPSTPKHHAPEEITDAATKS